jgi:hypothetical protein
MTPTQSLRLLNAATEMLGALRAAHDFIVGNNDGMDSSDDKEWIARCLDLERQVASAIAKAEGPPSLDGWAVLYRAATAPAVSPPECFLCQAEDGDHADEQCRNAYPGCEILWSYLGDAEGAYEEYWGNR